MNISIQIRLVNISPLSYDSKKHTNQMVHQLFAKLRNSKSS